MLRFTLFIRLTNSKVSVFQSISTYNTDFQIVLNKLANSRSILLSRLQLAVYLHDIEDTYSDFATFQRSATWANSPNILVVMAKLEDKTYIYNKPTKLPACSSNSTQGKEYSRENRSMRSQRCSVYQSRIMKSLETCLYYHTIWHSKLTY